MALFKEIEDHQRHCDEMRTQMKEVSLLGPWISELDRVEFMHLGLRCLIVRNPYFFTWNGYVGVSKSNPHFGKSSEELNKWIDVHGGATYAQECARYVCHEVCEMEPLYWIGFDCGHSGDYVPGMDWGLILSGYKLPSSFNEDAHYRDKYFVIAETRRLAEQLLMEDHEHGPGRETKKGLDSAA